jgi:hypothetical protein
VVDAGGDIIYKMNQDGKVTLRLGRQGASVTGPNNFNLPTDVAFAPNGDLYVSDGYANPRVVKLPVLALRCVAHFLNARFDVCLSFHFGVLTHARRSVALAHDDD